ncbi:TPA: inovirus-type Gp2 protein [Yersinia enterocolitica]|nr:inovirus-type Gp2 protein [Yersinia enterocolitica]
MQRYYPYLKSITPNDFLLNMINHHLNTLFSRHSKLLGFRMDFSYLHETSRFSRNSLGEIQADMRSLAEQMMRVEHVCGYFWVIEWTSSGKLHSHAVFYLNGQKIKKSFPFIQHAGRVWSEVTHSEGKYEWCKPQDYHRDNIHTVVDHRNMDDVHSLRRIISYLTKEEQKNGIIIWGCNEAGDPTRAGRPRSI